MGRPIAIEQRLTEYSGGSDFIDLLMATQILAKGDGDVIIGGAGDSNPRYSELAPYLGPAPITYRLSGDAIGIHAKEPGTGIIERDDFLNPSHFDGDGGSAGMHAKEPGNGIIKTEEYNLAGGWGSPYKKHAGGTPEIYAEDPLAISPYKKYAEDPLGMKRFGDSPSLEGLFDRLYAGVNGHEPSMTHYTDTKPGSSPRKDAILLGWPNIKQESRGFGEIIEMGWPNGASPIQYKLGVDRGVSPIEYKLGVDRVVLRADGVGYWKPPKIQAGGLQGI